MQGKTPLCRNFQAGSCRYGDRCKFVHPVQQQPKSNVFGSGAGAASHHQQTRNPFGFGVQNSSQSKASNEAGSKQNQFKPFENKWTRSSAAGGSSARQPDSQPQSSNHQCTDPEACKRVISEDFQHERPLWKLTCYGHCKNAPCDIVGDVSYEEMRAAAYDGAKRGLSMQSIVERERNMLSSKLIEFENLLRNPYATRPISTVATSQSPFPITSPNVSSVNPQNSAPPAFASFSQLGSSHNTGPSAPSVNAFGQSSSAFGQGPSANAFGQGPSANTFGRTPSANAFGQTPPANAFGQAAPANAFGQAAPANAFGQAPSVNAFGQAPSVNAFGQSPSVNAFGQSSTVNAFGQASPINAFGSPFGSPGSFGSQNPAQTFRNSFSSNVSGPGNSGITGAQSKLFSTSSLPTENPSSDGNGHSTSVQSIINQQRDSSSVDASIWLKEKWTPGEIPEEAPPDAYVF